MCETWQPIVNQVYIPEAWILQLMDFAAGDHQERVTRGVWQSVQADGLSTYKHTHLRRACRVDKGEAPE